MSMTQWPWIYVGDDWGITALGIPYHHQLVYMELAQKMGIPQNVISFGRKNDNNDISNIIKIQTL